MYGITETTVHTTYKEIGSNEIKSNVSNIGRPLIGYTTYIVDQDNCPVPVGVAGELLVGGYGVARGYLNRDELTKQRFISNPLYPKERVYRSGDLARYMFNGELEYLGRIDHQIKLHGFRIELSEIEQTLLSHPNIMEARVFLKESIARGKFLCAYYISHSALSPEDVKTFMAKMLPYYMIPAHIISITKFPLTINGKVDARALPEPTLLTDQKEKVPPNTKSEKLLASIWQKVLEQPNIGREDNFFDLESICFRYLCCPIGLFIISKPDVHLWPVFKLGVYPKGIIIKQIQNGSNIMKELVIRKNGIYVLHIFANDAAVKSNEVYFLLHGVPAINVKNEDIAKAITKHTKKDAVMIHYQGLGKSATSAPSFDFLSSVQDSISFAEELATNYEKIHLVGHSWGGCIALNVYREVLTPRKKTGQVILLAPFTEFPNKVPWLVPMVKDGRIPLQGGVATAEENFFAVKRLYPPKKDIQYLSKYNGQFTIIEVIDDPDVPNEDTAILRRAIESSGTKLQFYRIKDDHLFSQNREQIINTVLTAISQHGLNRTHVVSSSNSTSSSLFLAETAIKHKNNSAKQSDKKTHS